MTNLLDAQALSASLTVKDLPQSLAFYRDALGFSVDREHVRDGVVRAISLRGGAVRVLLNLDDGQKGWDRKKGEGVSLMITTSQSVDDIAAQIKSAGGTLLSEPMDMPWGPRMFRVKDPDGFLLAISTG